MKDSSGRTSSSPAMRTTPPMATAVIALGAQVRRSSTRCARAAVEDSSGRTSSSPAMRTSPPMATAAGAQVRRSSPCCARAAVEDYFGQTMSSLEAVTACVLDAQVLDKKFDCTSEPASVLCGRTSNASCPDFYYGRLFDETKLQAIPWEFVFFPSRPALQAPEGAEDCPGAGDKKSNHQLNPIPSHESNVYNQDCEYAVNLILQKDHGLPGLVSSNDHDGFRPADQARPPLPPTASRLKSAADILRLNRCMAF